MGMSTAPQYRNETAAIPAGNASGVGLSGPIPVPKQFVRIDAGHPSNEFKGEIELPVDPVAQQSSDEIDYSAAPQPDLADQLQYREQSWLQLHAIELIERLQAWSEDLDRREAHLNSRTALHEHRERQLRLQHQTSQLELGEMKSILEREVNEVRAAARRIAFE